MRAGWILAATFAAAAPAAAQAPAPISRVTDAGAIQLVVGDRITVRLLEGGRPEQVSVARAPAGGALPPKPGSRVGDLEAAPAGTVVLTLERTADGEVFLKLLSGVSRAFDYRAVLIHETAAAGQFAGEPTSVCTVLPLLASFEHWPGRPRTAGVLLTGFQFRDTNEVVCPDPATLPPVK
ncbi:hypothetical protein [Phenylobacterium sp.]|uniref:hypothetical protein n=1 Tax=Phenylobacterium sp. TaxID=1871053 RepID=UPI0035B3C3B0